LRVHPARPADPDMLSSQISQARPLSHSHRRDQPGPRHQMRVIKRRGDLRQLMQQSHLTGAPSGQVVEASATPIVPGQGAPFASTRRARTLFPRCIQAKTVTGLALLLAESGRHDEAVVILLDAAVSWHQLTGSWDPEDLSYLKRERKLIKAEEFTALIA